MRALVTSLLYLLGLATISQAESTCINSSNATIGNWCYAVTPQWIYNNPITINLTSGGLPPYIIAVHQIVPQSDGSLLHDTVAQWNFSTQPPYSVTWNVSVPVGTSCHVHYNVSTERLTTGTWLVMDAQGSSGGASTYLAPTGLARATSSSSTSTPSVLATSPAANLGTDFVTLAVAAIASVAFSLF